MEKRFRKITYAFLDAGVNALAIFTLTLGALILTSNTISSVTLRPALVTSFAVALIRFSLRLYQEDGVNLEGLSDLPQVPEVGSDSEKSISSSFHLFEIVTVKST